VFINNHTAVWGSFYDTSTGAWGFACCHSIIHASYCAGEAAIEAAKASSAQNLLAAPSRAAPTQSRSMVEQHLDEMSKSKGKERDRDEPSSLSKKHLGEGEIRLDKDKLSEAIIAERDRKRKGRHEEDEPPYGKRKKQESSLSSSNPEVTEEELGMCP